MSEYNDKNYILDNYSKQEILSCINYMIWHKKKLKDVDIKKFMVDYMDNKRINNKKNKLID